MGATSSQQDRPDQTVAVRINGSVQYVKQDAVTWVPPTAGSSAARLTDVLVKRHGWKPARVRRPQRACGARTRAPRRSNGSSGRPGQRHVARKTSSVDPGDSDPNGEPGPWPGGFTFRVYDELVSRALPRHVRLELFQALPDRWQREAWDALEIERGAGR
jgi:hypothetical protein